MNTITKSATVFLGLLALAGCKYTTDAGVPGTDADGFVPIFNGKDLTGWTPKIAGHQAGVNYKDTFVVEDGILKISYDNYETFNGSFGHLFYDKPYSHYILRMDYRFVGEQCPQSPSWTWINSGVMLHSQSAQSMAIDQQFPTSVECQTLGLPVGDERKRTTANVCTPGTTVVYELKRDRRHCISSTSPTFHGDQWIALDIEVHGYENMVFRVNGEMVLELEDPQLDINDERDHYAAKKIIEQRGGSTGLRGGYIALQAEGAPVQYRNIRLKVLDE